MSDAPAKPFPQEAYVTFSGELDDTVMSRFQQVLNFGVTNGLKRAHILFQSSGGHISAGIGLYNYLMGLPLEITTYNGGGVSSIAVIAFLAAKDRVACETATFMVHKGYTGGAAGFTAERLAFLSKDISINDERIEAILRSNIKLPQDKWEIHRYADVVITAKEALECGLITRIGDFKPPAGSEMVNIQSYLK